MSEISMHRLSVKFGEPNSCAGVKRELDRFAENSPRLYVLFQRVAAVGGSRDSYFENVNINRGRKNETGFPARRLRT